MSKVSSNGKTDKTENIYEQQERQLSAKSEALLEMLTNRGIVSDVQISSTKLRDAEKAHKRKVYHNTLVMLQNYRNIAWALECFPTDIAQELEQPMYDLDKLLVLVNNELDMENVRLEQRLQSIRRSRILMDRINEALSVLRKKPNNGEMMYNIIYHTYIVPEKLSHTDLLNRLNVSTRHYYRLRQQAINILSIRLWATPSGELDAWLEVLTLIESL